jgi:hypothetical protein
VLSKTEAAPEPQPPADNVVEGGAGQMPAEMPEPAMGQGMMAGMMMPGMMGRGGPGAKPTPEIKYDPTAWGRYAKVLLSSSEFLYIN